MREAEDAALAEVLALARLAPEDLARAQTADRLQDGLAGLTPADRRWFALKRFVAGLPGSLLPAPAASPEDAEASDARLAAHLLAGKANAARKQGRARLAVWQAHRALAGDPACYKAWYELGRALELLARPEEACDAYRMAIEHGLREPEVRDPFALSGALNDLAVLVEGAVGDGPAEALYRKAFAVRPTNGVAAYNLALLYKARGRWDEAIAWLSRAETLRPDDPDVKRELGIVRKAAKAGPPA